MKAGKVYILGAGPGDRSLITLKAADCLRRSDAIVYDRLIDSRILDHAPSNAERIDVGKRSGFHPVSQNEINHILYKLAEAGKTVARVKGGDPFLFGRGGEECEYLQEHGIRFEVIPGVTSAIAVPAYAGIPVTHRAHAASLHIFTGHAQTEGVSLDFETISRLEGTLVFLMGVRHIGQICSGLIDHGKHPDTPAAIIENGTKANQRVLTETLGKIAQQAAVAEIRSPAVIVVGTVAGLSQSLSWLSKGPLFGKVVVVTRPAERLTGLVEGLEAQGARVIEFPVIQAAAAQKSRPLQDVLDAVSDYQWLVFTSMYGVEMFFKQMEGYKKDIRLLFGIKLAAVGPATAAALSERGFFADFVPENHTALHLLDGLIQKVGPAEKCLLIQSDRARPDLSQGLKARGISFDEAVVYRIQETSPDASELYRLLDNRCIDGITFASPSAVKAFASIVGIERIQGLHAHLVCIGSATAAEAERLGMKAAGIAETASDAGIIKKLIEIMEEHHNDGEKT